MQREQAPPLTSVTTAKSLLLASVALYIRPLSQMSLQGPFSSTDLPNRGLNRLSFWKPKPREQRDLLEVTDDMCA